MYKVWSIQDDIETRERETQQTIDRRKNLFLFLNLVFLKTFFFKDSSRCNLQVIIVVVVDVLCMLYGVKSRGANTIPTFYDKRTDFALQH